MSNNSNGRLFGIAHPASFAILKHPSDGSIGSLLDDYPAIQTNDWNTSHSLTDNYDRLKKSALESERTNVLFGYEDDHASVLILSLLALVDGFEVYVCADMIGGDETEKRALLHRLTQHGCLIVTDAQLRAEFQISLIGCIG